MANAMKGETSLKAGSKEYILVMNINALCEAEDALGMATDEILARYSAGLSVKLLRGLIWAALQAKHPCTVDEAGQIIEAAGVPVAKAALEQAILASMPAPEAAEGENPPKRGRAGTGSSS